MNAYGKLKVTLGLNGLLCIVVPVLVVVALVTYSATVSINPAHQFTVGSTSDSWAIFVNEINKIRYLPGGSTEPTLDTGNVSTYAFKVVTDTQKVCAVKMELTSAINSSKFSNFVITVKYWTGAAWVDETLYDAPTGSTAKSYIDGLIPGDAGYIHQALSTTRYYLVKATFSYDKVDETAQVSVTFQYTPLPQDSF
jgi:hypothetical protein